MSLQSLRQHSWLRSAIAALLLCFALGTIAHAGHSHEQSSTRVHVVCDYCASFSDLVDAPLLTAVAETIQVAADTRQIPDTHFVVTRRVSVAQARAPPISF